MLVAKNTYYSMAVRLLYSILAIITIIQTGNKNDI